MRRRPRPQGEHPPALTFHAPPFSLTPLPPHPTPPSAPSRPPPSLHALSQASLLVLMVFAHSQGHCLSTATEAYECTDHVIASGYVRLGGSRTP